VVCILCWSSNFKRVKVSDWLPSKNKTRTKQKQNKTKQNKKQTKTRTKQSKTKHV